MTSGRKSLISLQALFIFVDPADVIPDPPEVRVSGSAADFDDRFIDVERGFIRAAPRPDRAEQDVPCPRDVDPATRLPNDITLRAPHFGNGLTDLRNGHVEAQDIVTDHCTAEGHHGKNILLRNTVEGVVLRTDQGHARAHCLTEPAL